jgi:hypothetical protein
MARKDPRRPADQPDRGVTDPNEPRTTADPAVRPDPMAGAPLGQPTPPDETAPRDRLPEEDADRGVGVYDRPARSGMPMTTIIAIIVVVAIIILALVFLL